METGTIKGGKRNLLIAGMYEMIGTAILLYGLNMANSPFVLFLAGLLSGGVSGGHFNWAVSLAVFIAEERLKENAPKLAVFWIFQLLGGFLGVTLVFFSHRSGAKYNEFEFYPSVPESEDQFIIPTLMFEGIGTFLFVAIILA